ncbi:MAG: hypothetical protein HRU36_03945 [Rickettsiales bacterium]|nr:hypothetical protein [Rickettsiales bacterium]
MLLRPFLNTISNAYNGLYWVGENILNIPLTQMGQASQLTTSGYSFFDNVSSMVSYQPETIAGRLVKTAMTSAVTSAVFATVVGGGIAASPYVATVAAATSTGLFVVENLFGKGAREYTGAYLQYGTAGVALEATTKAVDYGISFVREDWDQNYVTNYKNILLSTDLLVAVARGEKAFLSGYMKDASNYLNNEVYNYLIDNSIVNAVFDLYAAYKLLGLAGMMTSGLTSSLETGHTENLHDQMRNDPSRQRLLQEAIREAKSDEHVKAIESVYSSYHDHEQSPELLEGIKSADTNSFRHVDASNPHQRFELLQDVKSHSRSKLDYADYDFSGIEKPVQFNELAHSVEKNANILAGVRADGGVEKHQFENIGVQPVSAYYSTDVRHGVLREIEADGGGLSSGSFEEVEWPTESNFGVKEYAETMNPDAFFLSNPNPEFQSLAESVARVRAGEAYLAELDSLTDFSIGRSSFDTGLLFAPSFGGSALDSGVCDINMQATGLLEGFSSIATAFVGLLGR